MSKRLFFKRYLWIYEVIKQSPGISLIEITKLFENASINDDGGIGFSERTFRRDLIEIQEIFGVNIEYNRSKNGYYIENDLINTNTNFIIDSYKLLNVMYNFKNYNKFILPEKTDKGTQHIESIFESIINRKKIKFDYKKYTDEIIEERLIEPYFIKEFKKRWYVIGNELSTKKCKTFALERIVNQVKTIGIAKSYTIPSDLSPDKYFENNFGIFKLENEVVNEIILSFNHLKSKFIKSQPLHHSQLILIDNIDELQISIKVQITHDLIMELLSHGSEVKIISPEVLKNKIKDELRKASELYL